jgi:hypothetical protein
VFTCTAATTYSLLMAVFSYHLNHKYDVKEFNISPIEFKFLSVISDFNFPACALDSWIHNWYVCVFSAVGISSLFFSDQLRILNGLHTVRIVHFIKSFKRSFMTLIIDIRQPNVRLGFDMYVKRVLNPNFIRYIYNHIDSVMCGWLAEWHIRQLWLCSIGSLHFSR